MKCRLMRGAAATTRRHRRPHDVNGCAGTRSSCRTIRNRPLRRQGMPPAASRTSRT